jgi:hypothetical protein
MTNLLRLVLAACSLAALESAHSQIGPLQVGISRSSISPGDAVGVTLALTPIGKLPRKLPQGSNSTAWYTACTTEDENVSAAQHPADFCKNGSRTFLADTTSKAESVNEIGNGKVHTFSDNVSLPKSPSGTKVFFVVALDTASPPDQIHTTSYGIATLLYRCETGKGEAKTTLRSCRYWTPNAWALHRAGPQRLPPVVPKPKP